MQITIEAPISAKELFENYERSTGHTVDYLTTDNLMGNEVISFILALTVATAPYVTKIIIQVLQNKKGVVSIDFNGKKIANLTEETAERIINKLLEQDSASENIQ